MKNVFSIFKIRYIAEFLWYWKSQITVLRFGKVNNCIEFLKFDKGTSMLGRDNLQSVMLYNYLWQNVMIGASLLSVQN